MTDEIEIEYQVAKPAARTFAFYESTGGQHYELVGYDSDDDPHAFVHRRMPSRLFLQSLNGQTIWTSPDMTAECTKGVSYVWTGPRTHQSRMMEQEEPPHVAPFPDCSCGIYSFTTVQEVLRQYGQYGAHVIGVVEPYGTAEQASLGQRSAKVLLLALWVENDHRRAQLQASYPTVRMFDDIAELMAAYPDVDDGTGAEGVLQSLYPDVTVEVEGQTFVVPTRNAEAARRGFSLVNAYLAEQEIPGQIGYDAKTRRLTIGQAPYLPKQVHVVGSTTFTGVTFTSWAPNRNNPEEVKVRITVGTQAGAITFLTYRQAKQKLSDAINVATASVKRWLTQSADDLHKSLDDAAAYLDGKAAADEASNRAARRAHGKKPEPFWTRGKNGKRF